jgi:hypothetical protein
MPIKDLSDRGRVPRLGKIHLGVKVQGEKSEYPKATDYFVCPEEVRAVYGEKPKQLKVAFHSDNIEEIFSQYYKRYGSGTGLVCKGDGETAMTLVPSKKQMQEIQCLGRECDFYKADKCTQVGNLIFMIRGVERFGVYQLDTGSYNTILNVNGGLEFVKQITNGRLKMVPLILEVIPQEVNPEGKKKTVYVLRIEADVKAIMDAMESERPGDVLFLESKDEIRDIEEDIHPQSLVQSIKGTDDPDNKVSQKPNDNEISFNKHGQVDWSYFWAKVKELGITRNDVHGVAGVESVKDFSIEQIDKLYSELLSFKNHIEDQRDNPLLNKEENISKQESFDNQTNEQGNGPK